MYIPSVIIGTIGGPAKKVSVVWRDEPGVTPYAATEFKIYNAESEYFNIHCFMLINVSNLKQSFIEKPLVR